MVYAASGKTSAGPVLIWDPLLGTYLTRIFGQRFSTPNNRCWGFSGSPWNEPFSLFLRIPHRYASSRRYRWRLHRR